VLSAQGAQPGLLIPNCTLLANTNTPGRVVLSLASSSAISGSGTLVYLTFNVLARPPASSSLVLTNILLNDGAIAPVASPGLFTVNGFWTVGGNVTYFQGGGPVSKTSLSAVGVGTYATLSDTNGAFTLTNLPTGSYTLTPSKSDDVAAITAYDASLVLQAAAGLITLSPAQQVAADVNRNGSINAMDAAYILQKAVGLLPGPFPNAGMVWDFIPETLSYPVLNGNLSGQDFTAVLLGDVSGNWTPAAAAAVTAGESPQVLAEPDRFVTLALDTGLGPTEPGVGRVIFKCGAQGPPIYSIDLVLAFDAQAGSIQQVRASTATAAWILACNTNQPGIVRVGLASATSLAREGELLAMNLGRPATSQARIYSASINEGAVPVRIVAPQCFHTDDDTALDTGK
jgi:hypothetical protein